MRIPTSFLYEQNIRAINNNQNDLVKTQEQLSTLKRINDPSDDPIGAAKVIRLTETIDKLTQFQRNNDLFQSSIEQQEVVLTNITDSLQRARVLTIQAGSGIFSQSDREAIAAEVEQIRNEVFDLFNAQNANGEYIFSGYQSNTQAYDFNPASANSFEYLGDAGTNTVRLSDSVEVRSSVSGQQVFENALARFNYDVTGVSGTASVSDTVITQQGTFDQFYENNYDALNPANNDFQFTILGSGDIQLTNVGTGAIVSTQSFTSGQPFTVNGAQFTIEGSAGDTVDLSLRAPEKKNVAETLNDLVIALQDPSSSDSDLREAIADALVGIDNGTADIAQEVSSIGGRLNTAQSIYETNLDLEIVNAEARSEIEDTDFAQASADFSRQEAALEAVLTTFPRISNLSLFNFIS
ncbi:flagellar hook-associated protein FlgL [Alteromonas sp. 5E99-2]|uniref:flagellar hook-associated protein FlgL n=1 Tax=Alteromonas sp. 5E99-2 TaxID=2817683 RepID=UPI001A98BB8A|nr:flagellar hook-associated protein FlgL [Alteromonas sp. 5E99-2]MBO1255260.1 flagellar hook-associated protein FlgL [Alteromonas sp. 5E99-2]